jgi:hypothetical protein
MKCIEITLDVFAHLSMLQLPIEEALKYRSQGYLGNRIDILVDNIIRCLKGSTEYGVGELQLRDRNSMSISQPNPNYYGKYIAFHVYDF